MIPHRTTWAAPIACVLSAGGVAANDGVTVGVYGGTGSQTIEQAIAQGVDMLFPSVTWYEEHDFLKGVAARCRAAGIEVYPSYAVAGDGYGDKQSAFAAANPQWWEKRRNGSPTNHGEHVGLSFGVPEVRAYKVQTIARRVADYDLDGVMLDYTRLFDATCGYHDSIVDAFRRATGRDAHAIPNDDEQWVRFRASFVTQFVRELRAAADAIGAERGRPVKLVACVNPEPELCLRNVMQDWQTWVDEGLVDLVVTMIYERDTNNTIRRVQIASAACAGKAPHIPMVAPYDGLLTTDEQVLDASLKCLKSGADGVAFYRSDYIDRYGVWDAIGEVCAWTTDDIANASVNYALNPGFEFGDEAWALGDGGASIVEDDAHAGKHALSLAGGATARQIVDRGLFGEAKSLNVSLAVDASALTAHGRVYVEVNVNTIDGRETYARAPLTIQAGARWQRCEVSVPLASPDDIRWLIVALSADEDAGVVRIDDVRFTLNGEPASESHVIDARAAAAHWRPRGNIARGQIVTASSFWETGFEPSRAVDGNLASDDYGRGAAWHSQRPAIDQWLQVYLPAPTRLDRVRLLNASAQSAYRTRDFRIEVSTDGTRFHEVARGTLPDDGETWTELKLKELPAVKYVRFHGIRGYNTAYAVGLKEIEIYPRPAP